MAYSDNLRKAVTGVLAGDRYSNIQQQLLANVNRFAAYKAWHATRQIERQRADSNGVERSNKAYEDMAKVVLGKFNRYQVAEHNTAIARTRTAKQWMDFHADPVSNELYPNLRWLPSRSADPREEHMRFYGIVLPKNDPFWQHNQPGNLWNCKCDWEETDAPADTVTPDKNIHAKGLEGNPAESGEVFTKEAAYFKAAGDRENTIQKDILSLKENSYYQVKVTNVPVNVHTLHNPNEIAGNMETLNAFLKAREDVQKVSLLPVISKGNIKQRADFYPEGQLPRGQYNNADAIIKFKNGEQWVADFKTMRGNGRNLYRTLKEEAYEQAEYAIIKIKGNRVEWDDVKEKADKFMSQYRKFKGIFIYNEQNINIYERISAK
jgi:hypothetical protein